MVNIKTREGNTVDVSVQTAADMVRGGFAEYVNEDKPKPAKKVAAKSDG